MRATGLELQPLSFGFNVAGLTTIWPEILSWNLALKTPLCQLTKEQALVLPSSEETAYLPRAYTLDCKPKPTPSYNEIL